MNIKLKKIRNNTDSRQSKELVIPLLNSTDKYNSSFHRPQLITRTIHSRKNGLTWLLYYTSSVRTTKSLYIKKNIIYNQIRYAQYLGLSEEWSTERDVIDGSNDDTAETDLYLWTIPTNEYLFFFVRTRTTNQKYLRIFY